MTQFSNISTSKKEEKPKASTDNFELKQAEEKARKKAEAEALEVEAPIETGTPLGVEEFTSFIGSDREIPDMDEPDAIIDDGTGGDEFAEDAERLKKDESWFKRTFGGKDDSPVSEEDGAEMDAEMYEASGTIGAEITDTVLPSLINSMQGSDDVNEYRASEEQKKGLARAWELYLRSIKRKVTPLTYLLGKIAIVYGGKFVSGLFMYLSRLREIGMHWPWSNGWKAKFKYVSAEPEYYGDEELEPAPQAPQAPQAPPPPPPPEPTLTKVPVAMKECMYDGTSFEAGKGFPKTSTKEPHFIDMFSTYKKYMTYVNENGLRNTKKA